MLNINKNLAKLKQYYYFHAKFLEEVRYKAGRKWVSIFMHGCELC